MPPIPVHKASPIHPNAAKASGPTANPAELNPTAGDDTRGFMPASVPATTTSAAPQLPTPAQPGAAAMPAPTQTANSSHPVGPTPTAPLPTSTTSNGPPPPQPGAVPSPYTAPSPSTRPSVPPPPKAGETPQSSSFYAPQPTSTYNSPNPVPLPLHQQFGQLSTPTRAQPPASMTSTTSAHDLSHPPGYTQNARASFDERPIDPYRPFESSSNDTSKKSGGGILGSGPGNQGYQDVKGGIWDTAVSWAKSAGEKLSQGEEEVWKAINAKK